MLRSSLLACSMISNCTRLAVRSCKSCCAIFWRVCRRLPLASSRNCTIARMTIWRTAAALPPVWTPSTTAWSSCPASQTWAAGIALWKRVMTPSAMVKPRWVFQTRSRTRGTPISEARAFRAVSRSRARSPGPRPSLLSAPPGSGVAPRCARLCSRSLRPRPDPGLPPPPRPFWPPRPVGSNPVIHVLSVSQAVKSSVLNVVVSERFAPDTNGSSGNRDAHRLFG